MSTATVALLLLLLLIELWFYALLYTKQVILETFPQANLLAWYGKTKPSATKAHIHQSKEM